MKTSLCVLVLTGCVAEVADAPPEPVRFAFPVAEPERIGDVLGVDHDDVTGEGLLARMACTDFAGRSFPHCYDGHDGTDFILVGGFDAMDADSATVIAAAPGVVIRAEDDHYDRCRATLSGDIDCDGHAMAANRVHLEHADGTVSTVLHLMRGSVDVAVGDEVARGDVLGRIGSSGFSSMPHLHFEVFGADGSGIDPFTDPAGDEASWWCDQGAVGQLPGGCR